MLTYTIHFNNGKEINGYSSASFDSVESMVGGNVSWAIFSSDDGSSIVSWNADENFEPIVEDGQCVLF